MPRIQKIIVNFLIFFIFCTFNSNSIEDIYVLSENNFIADAICKAIDTGIGYKELYKYFSGEISLDEAIDLIKKNSRNYAKRQYTFFNHQLPVNWFNVNFKDFNKTIAEVESFIDKEKED